MRVRVPPSTLIGLGLIALGIVSYGGIERWMNTRIVYPVDIPISLAAGHIRTGPFRLNLRTGYKVFIAIPYSWQWQQANPECDPYRHSKRARFFTKMTKFWTDRTNRRFYPGQHPSKQAQARMNWILKF